MTKKPYFKNVDLRADFPELEELLVKNWYANGTVAKYLTKNNNSKKYFSFQDGPITANNPMGVHHAWGRSYKDLWQKFHTMCGHKQRYRNGFDCQGLWVEVEVEKELGLKSKKDIENLVPGKSKESIAKFVELCKERVNKFAGIQTEQSKRLGYFMDWENSYFTMSEENNYMIWHFLKVCYEHGWIYKGKESVPWCPRCETAISQHEMLTEDYKEVVHESVYLKLPIVGREKNKEYLLIWTTTPWTIPANIAVALDTQLTYSLVEDENGDYVWVAKEAVERLFGSNAKIIKSLKGDKLVGLHYYGPFDEIPAVKEISKLHPDTFHTVVPTDKLILPITTTEGTGLVHTAVSAGVEDFKLGKKLNLPMIAVIDDTATYLEGLGFLSGHNAKKHPEIVLDFLKKPPEKSDFSWVLKTEHYKHRYPACWRCKTELVWKVADEWYIAMDTPSAKDKKDTRTLRERMMDVAKKITWIPSFGLERELDWLSNMHDWLISKPNRYWGLALPIYECQKCGNFEVLGGSDDLKKRAVSGWSQFEGKTPHKPWIDEVVISCTKCGGQSLRIEDVGNPWLDAGIVPYSTISKNNINTPLYWQDKKEWRKWFPVNFITESFPGQFKNWFYAMIAMSTVLEDERPFQTVLGFATLLAEDGRPMHKSWGNSIEFNEGAKKIGVDVMRWMYARQDPSENLLFGYKIADEVRRRFHLKLWNVYNFFVTYANSDGWEPNGSAWDNVPKVKNKLDKWILSRLGETQEGITKSLSAFKPQLAAGYAESFLEDLSNWYIRRSRDRVGPKAVNAADRDNFYQTTYFVLTVFVRLLAPIMPFMTELIWRNLTKLESVHLSDWPEEIPKDKKLINDMAVVRTIVEIGHALRKEREIPVKQPLDSLKTTMPSPPTYLSDLLTDELNVKKWLVTEGKEIKNELDTNITPELEEEAKVRDLVRQVQQKRKELGLGVTDLAVVFVPWLPESAELQEKIKTLTLASTLSVGKLNVLPVE